TIPGHVENGVWRPELTPELLDQIISESSGSVARINLSNSTVHSAALSITALSQIATASHSAQIVMPGGMTMTLPPAVLTHLASAATTAGVHDVVLGMAPVAHSAIPEAQAGNIATGDAVFSITLTAGTTAITDLGGSISVTLPWEGPWPAVVWHLAADGTLTRMTTTYNQAGGTVTFTTNHLSMFLVRQGDSSTASNGVVIFLGLAGTALAVSGAGIVIATKKLRKK
ncbi:MAG: hypothetical protein LBC71_00645, partial [Oscillospiraceae bacterium]|nr:hypothetical protein [Oscillospiraceae bacterium]